MLAHLFLLTVLIPNIWFVASYKSPFVEFKDTSDYKRIDVDLAHNDNSHNNLNDLNSDPSIVNTNFGYIEGILTDTARVFRKIPYAKPPVNKTGRWQSPQFPDAWGSDQILQAKGDPPACPQSYCGQWEACGKKHTQLYSEDCLYLNVYTPINMTFNNGSDGDSNGDSSDSALLPVMFFIHGGMYLDGYGGGYIYNGSDITNLTNVITVTINYRLGALGYYWNDKYDFDGNYGIEDQILALKWVNDNIEYFGGDPDHVTVFGQSAGAMSTAILGMIPEARELYYNGIWESEPLGIPMRNSHTWGEIPQLFIELADCIKESKEEIIDCLYNLDQNTIIDLQSQIDASIVQLEKFMDAFVPWTPTMGSELISMQPYWYYSNLSNIGTTSANDNSDGVSSNGNMFNKPLLAGVVKDEGNLFVYTAFPDGIDYELLITLFHIILKTEANVNAVLNQYPLPTNTSDYRAYASNVITDGLFHCPNRNVTATLSLATDNGYDYYDNTYLYHFNHIPSFGAIMWDPINATECLDRVCHGSDLPFVFRPNAGPLNVTYTTDEFNMAQAMQFYWSNFGKYNNPGNGRTYKYNNGTNVNWANFNNTQQNTMVLQAGDIQVISDYDKEKCLLWDQMNYPWVPYP